MRRRARAERPARRRGCCRRAARRPPRGAPGLARSRGRRRRRATMSAAKENPCRKFQANIFNKSKCQNCFKPRESHLLNDKDLTQVQTKEEPLPPASSQSIPTFYFPRGRPQGTVNVDAVIAKIERTFAQFPHERATMEDMGKVAKVVLKISGTLTRL
nr:uncharacterized protein LOC123283895 isoform X6 [Equus asinus]